MSEEPSTPRRLSTRTRKLSLKALENITSPVVQTPTKTPRRTRRNTRDSEGPFEEQISEEEENEESAAKTTSKILHDNEIGGDKMFAFQRNKRRVQMLQKAAEIQQQYLKTPHGVRNRIKRQIVAKIVEENESSEEEPYSDSGSEYKGSDEQESDGSDEEVSGDEEYVIAARVAKTPSTRSTRGPPNKRIEAAKKRNKNYTIQTEEYFSNNASKKIVTSNHTLDKLETPRLMQDQLQTLLANLKLNPEHSASLSQLEESNVEYFDKWLYLLHENFNVLLYGLGSKTRVLDSFHEQCLKKFPVIVVNGFFPSLTIKEVLDGIILELLELKENPANVYEACELIEREFSYIPDTHLYFLVYNIDMMRSGKTQSVFAKLAAVRNIHLVASIDHINAPLIWDHSKLSKFNFTWWDVTCFQPYLAETSFESSMMVQRTGNLALSSLRNVFLSLTSNSKGIYLVLVKHQLEHGKNQYYQGLPFKELYSMCRESFLVSSDLALRAQLTEFVDHKMVKYKRSPDGSENLLIPIPNALLEQFLSEHDTA